MRCFHERHGYEKLLIFFNGWGMDERPFHSLELGTRDVLMFYDYRTVELPANSFDIFSEYRKFELFAWSFGVFFAALLRTSLPTMERAVACAGTLWPLDRKRGIPPRSFEWTLRQADRSVAGPFYERLFSCDQDYRAYQSHPVDRSVEERVEELTAVNRHMGRSFSAEPMEAEPIESGDIISPSVSPSDWGISDHRDVSRRGPVSAAVQSHRFVWSGYDTAIIPDTDRIFPPENQRHSWACVKGTYPPLQMVELHGVGHFPFYRFQSWSELLDISIPKPHRGES